MAPSTQANSFRAKFLNTLSNNCSPIITAAKPMTIAPLPMLMSAKPWY